MNVRNLLVVAIGLLSVTTFKTPAGAVDGKTFPGTMCQPLTASQPLARSDSGRTLNTSSGQQWFDCPIVRDTMAAKSTGIVAAFVKVQDLHPVQDVICELWSQRNDGSTVVFSSRRTTGLSSALLTLSYGSLASSDKGFYHVFCAVPAAHPNGLSGIAMYYVEEAE